MADSFKDFFKNFGGDYKGNDYKGDLAKDLTKFANGFGGKLSDKDAKDLVDRLDKKKNNGDSGGLPSRHGEYSGYGDEYREKEVHHGEWAKCRTAIGKAGGDARQPRWRRRRNADLYRVQR